MQRLHQTGQQVTLRKGSKMNRTDFEGLVSNQFGIDPENPWPENPGHRVFRHSRNNKWFALLMDVPKAKLGLSGEGSIDVVNLKCDPDLIQILRQQEGFFPACHMNKSHWISVALDRVDDGTIADLLAQSYALTEARPRKRTCPTAEQASNI